MVKEQEPKKIIELMLKTLECSICLEVFTNPVTTRCGHQFCRFCMMELLSHNKRAACPLCKKHVNKRGLAEQPMLCKVIEALQDVAKAWDKEVNECVAKDVIRQSVRTSGGRETAENRDKQENPANDMCRTRGGSALVLDNIGEVKIGVDDQQAGSGESYRNTSGINAEHSSDRGRYLRGGTAYVGAEKKESGAISLSPKNSSTSGDLVDNRNILRVERLETNGGVDNFVDVVGVSPVGMIVVPSSVVEHISDKPDIALGDILERDMGLSLVGGVKDRRTREGTERTNICAAKNTHELSVRKVNDWMKNVADILRSETAADSVVDEHMDSLEGDGSENIVKKNGKDEERRDVRGLRKDVVDHVHIEMNQDVEQGYRIVENVVASTKRRIFKTKNPGSGFDVDNMDVDESRIEDVPETGGVSDQVPGDPYEFVSSQRTPRASRRKGRRKENRDKDVIPRLCKQPLTLFIDDREEGQIFDNSVNEKTIDLCPVSERTRNSRDNYEIRDICSKRSNKPERVSGFVTDRSIVIEKCASYFKSGKVAENIDGFTQSFVVCDTLQNTTSVVNVDTQSGDTGDAMMIQYDTCGDTQPFIPEIESCITENDSVNQKGDKSVSNENNDKKTTFDMGECETEQSGTTGTVQGNNHVSEVSISESEQEDAMESMALRDKRGGKRGDNMMLPPQIVEETQIIGHFSEDGADGLTSLSKISVNRDIGEERNVSDGCGFSDDQDEKVVGERKVAIKRPSRSSLKRKREAERLSRDVTRLEKIATKINQAEDYSLLMCSQDVGLNMTSQMHREVETPMIATSQKAGHIKEMFTSECGASWLRSRTGCLESKTSSGDGIIPDSKITDNISPTPAAYTRERLVKYTTFKEAFNGLETRIKSSSLERNNQVMFASFDDEKRKPCDKSFLHVRETQLSCDLFSKATGASLEKKTRVKGGAVLLTNVRLHEIFSESRTGDGVEETYEGLGVPEPISDDSTEDLGIVEENCCYLQPSPESGSTHQGAQRHGGSERNDGNPEGSSPRYVSETGAGISETSGNVSCVGADVFAATVVMFSDENENGENEHVRIRLNDDWIGKKVVERIPASSVVDLFGGDVDSPGEDTQEYSVLKGSNAQDCCSDAGIVPDCSVDVNRVGACAGFIGTRGVDNCYTSEGKSENMNDSKELDTFVLGEVISNLCPKENRPNEDMRKPKNDRASCLTVDGENGIIVIENSLKEPVNEVISDNFTDPCNVVVPEAAESGSPFVPQILGFVPDSCAVSVERVSKHGTSGMSSSSSEVFLDPFSARNKIAASKVFHEQEGLSDGELEAIKSDANEVGSGQPRLKEPMTIPNVFDREMYKEVRLLGSSPDKENIEPSVEVLNGKVSREENLSTIKEATNICEERILDGDKGHCVSLSLRAESKANQIGLSETSHVQMVCSSLTTARDGNGRLSKSDDTVGYDRNYKQLVVRESCDVLCSIEPDDEGKQLSLNSKRIRSSQRKMHEMQQACRKLQSLREYGCEGVATDGICRALERSKSPLLETSGDEDVVFKNEVEESSEILDNDYECDIIRNTSVVVNSKEMTQSLDLDPRVYQAECTTVVRGDIDLEKVEVFNDSLKNGDGCLNSETNSDCLTSSYRSLPNTNGGKAIDDMLNDSLLGKIQGHIDQASKLIDRNIVYSQLETCDYEVESVERDEENQEVLNNESIDRKDAREVERNRGLADSSCLDGAENLLVNTELHTLAKIDGKAGFVEDTIQDMSIENEDADMKVPELEKLRYISTRIDALQNVSILRLDDSAVSQFPWSPSPESLPYLESIFHEEVRGRTGEERRGELNTTKTSVINGRRDVSGDSALKQPKIAEEINDTDASYKRHIDVEDLREVNEKSRNDGIKQSFNDAKLRLSNEQSKARDSKLRTNIDDAAREAEIHRPCIEEIVFDTELSDQGEVSVMDVKVHNKRTTRESCDSSLTSDEGSPVVRKKIKKLATKVLIESSDDDSPRTSPRYGDDSVKRREDSRYVAVSEDIKAGATDEAQTRSVAAILSDSETDVDQVLGDIRVLEVPLSESEQGDPTETMVEAKMTDDARLCGEEHNDDCGLRTVNDEGRSVVSSDEDDDEDDEVVIDRLKRKRAMISDSDDDDDEGELPELPNHADIDHCSNDDNLMDPDHFDADQDTCIDLTHSTISTQSELLATQQRANLQAEMLEMRSKIAELESLLKARTQAKTSLVRRDCPERTGNTGNAGSRGNRKRQKCREVGSFLDGDSARYSGSIVTGAKNGLNSSHCSRQVCDLNRSLNDSCDAVDISRANDFAESLYRGNATDMDDRCAVELEDVVSQRCTELYPGDISPKKLSRVLPEVVGSLRETFGTGFKGNKCPSQEFLGDQRHVDVRVDGRHGIKSSSYPRSVSEMAKNNFRRSLFKDGHTNREDKLRRNVCGEEHFTIEGTLKENPFKELHKIEQIIPREKYLSQKDRVVKADDPIVVPESELLDTCPDSQESKVAILSCVEVVEDSCDDLFNSPTTGSQNDVENPRRSKRRLHERSPRSLLIGSKPVREGNYEEDCGKSSGVRESDKPTMNPESLIDSNSQNMAEGDDVCGGSGNGLLVVENNGFARRHEKMAQGNFEGDDGTPNDICRESEVGIMMSSSEVHRSVSLIDVARSRVAENESLCEYSGLNENEVFGYCREEKSRRECDTSVGLGASVDDSKVLFSEGIETEKDVIDSVHAKKSAESFGVDETLAVKYRREADDVERAGEVDDCCDRDENSRCIVNHAESALTDGKIDDRTTAGREGTVVCQERVEALNRTVKGERGTSRGKGKRDDGESESVIGGESAEEGGGKSGASLWQRACMGGSGDEARTRDKITVEVCDLLDDRVTSSQTDATVECGMRNSVGKLGATGKKRLCFVSSGLRQEQVLNIRRLADRVGALFCDRFSPSVTHVIVKTEGTEDRACERTLKYLQGVSNHCWVVSYAWVAESLTATDLLPEAAFEMDRDSESDVSHYAPRRARLSQRPPFLSFEFFLHDASDNLPESELRDMLEMGGATVVLDHRFFSFDPRRNCLVIDQSDSTTVTATKLAVYKKFHADFGLTCISRDWALDSIAQYRAQPLQRYTLPHTQ